MKLQEIEECIKVTNDWISELEHILTHGQYRDGTPAKKPMREYEVILQTTREMLLDYMQERSLVRMNSFTMPSGRGH